MSLAVLSCLFLTPKICCMTHSVKHLWLFWKYIFRQNFYSSERACLGHPNLVLDAQFCFILLDSKLPITWASPPVRCQCLTLPSKGKVSVLCLARCCFAWYPQNAELCNTHFQNKRHWELVHFCRCEGAGWISVLEEKSRITFPKAIRKSLQISLFSFILMFAGPVTYRSNLNSSLLHFWSFLVLTFGPTQKAALIQVCFFAVTPIKNKKMSWQKWAEATVNGQQHSSALVDLYLVPW